MARARRSLHRPGRALGVTVLLLVVAVLPACDLSFFSSGKVVPLRWLPPTLESPTTLRVPVEGGSFRLDAGTDYIVDLPDAAVTGPLSLEGGRDVVVVGGEIRPATASKAALTMRNWSGTFHVEGVVIDPGGARGLEQAGIRVTSTEAASVAQIQHVYVAPVRGSAVLQTWAGPRALRVDHLTGSSDHRGLMLSPREFYDGPLDRFEFHHVDLHRTRTGSGSLYVQTESGGAAPAPVVSRAFAAPAPGRTCATDTAVDGEFAAAGVRCGAPDEGPWVDRGDIGLGYDGASIPARDVATPAPSGPTPPTGEPPAPAPSTTAAPAPAPPTTQARPPSPPPTTVPPTPTAPAPSGRRWSPPRLSSPSDVAIPVGGGTFNLDASRDYRLVFPTSPVTGPLRVNGGRNVVAVGGEMRMSSGGRAAMWFNNFSGTLHLEGLRIDPGGSRGIDQDAIRIISTVPGSIAQLQTIWVDQVHGGYDIEHGDILQTWAGPTELRIDRMTGFTDYQGFFLAPSHFGPEGFPLVAPKLSNIDLHMVKAKGWVLFALSDQGVTSGERPPPVPSFERVFADPGTVSSYPAVAGNGPILSADPAVGLWTPQIGNMVARDRVGIGYQGG